MDDNKERIFDASEKIISKLQLLSTFFDEEVIFRILVRTQVIHKLFETTPDLDINRLELYHLQFTESIVELLRKLKKTNEKNVTLLYDEIDFNKQLISRFAHELESEETYETEQHHQARRVSESIFKLYQNLSDIARDNPFPAAMYQFGKQFAALHFHEIPSDQLEEWTQYNLEDDYKNGYGIISKKLLGLECRFEFENVFVGGLKSGDDTLELYRINKDDTYLFFYPAKNLYKELDHSLIAHIDFTTPMSAKARMVHELQEKNLQLQASEEQVRTRLTDEMKQLLEEYLNRITLMNFLDTKDYEVQANILRAMLQTDGL